MVGFYALFSFNKTARFSGLKNPGLVITNILKYGVCCGDVHLKMPIVERSIAAGAVTLS